MECSREEEDVLARSTKKLKDHHDTSNTPAGEALNVGPFLGNSKEKLMGVIPGAFKQAFGLQGIMQEEEESNIDEEPAHEGWASVLFSREDKARMRAPWLFAIIVITYGRNVGFSFLSSRICSLWNPSGKLDYIDLGHDYFLIKFDCPQDLDKVLMGGPWFIGQ